MKIGLFLLLIALIAGMSLPRRIPPVAWLAAGALLAAALIYFSRGRLAFFLPLLAIAGFALHRRHNRKGAAERIDFANMKRVHVTEEPHNFEKTSAPR